MSIYIRGKKAEKKLIYFFQAVLYKFDEVLMLRYLYSYINIIYILLLFSG